MFTVCSEKLGVENGDIPDGNISASDHITKYEPWKARLNGEGFGACYGYDVEPWIQADVGNQIHVSGVITQGDGGIGSGNTEDWVTSLKVSTKMTPHDDEVFVTENGTVKVSVITLKTYTCFDCQYIYQFHIGHLDGCIHDNSRSGLICKFGQELV